MRPLDFLVPNNDAAYHFIMADAQTFTPSRSFGADSHHHVMDAKASIAATTPVAPATKSTPTLKTKTVSELMARRAQERPSTRILGYPSSGTDYVEYTFGQLNEFSDSAAHVLSKALPIRTDSAEKAKVVALLGPSNLDYVIALVALAKLGFTALLLSPRLAVPAYEHLLETTGCKHIIVGRALVKITDELQARHPSLTVMEFVPQSRYEQREEFTPPVLDLDQETEQIAWIIHSSGSTGPPKPIYQTHHAALRNCENNMDMEGFITLPLYHGHGVSSVFRAFTCAKKIFLMNAGLPLTSTTLVHIMRNHKFEIFYGVPYALKLLAESEEGLVALSEMKVVMFGGSACPDSLGDLLVDRGVKLISHYGCSETGQLMTSARSSDDKAWNYVRVHERLRPHVKFEQQGDSKLFELVVGPGWPSKVATNREDGSYATKDLFIPHPTFEGAWKYISRRDDTIILVNGEKVIPIAMEQAVRRQPVVREALVFGTGQSHVGLLLFVSESAADLDRESLIDAIWPTVAEENAELPDYGRLNRSMVSLVPPGIEFPATDKGTIIRQAAYQAFKDLISEAYQSFENQNGGTLVLSLTDMKKYLRERMVQLFGLEESLLIDTADLFALGVDSLQSALLRTQILKDVDFKGNSLPQNIVFEFPSISKLAHALISIRDNVGLAKEDVAKQMASLVEKYSQWSPHRPQVPKIDSKTAVAVTGATGSLGAHLVAQLANKTDIDVIYCLVRADSDDCAMQRVVESMRRRRVYHNLSQAARSKLRFYASNFSNAQLGLSEVAYESLRTSVISIMHCAWSVNFNKHLSSFEDCISGVHNLASLCLRVSRLTPATLNFCSSVSTVSRSVGVIPTSVPGFEAAHSIGYAQSKLVSEHLLQKAARETGILARVIRVGQITADSIHGIWNETEAIPLILNTIKTLGILPAFDETHRWLPIDTVASAFVDISLSGSTDVVFNLVNSNAFHWTADLLPRLREAGLAFTEVDQIEWLKELRQSSQDPAVNPTIKLLDFYEAKYGIAQTKRVPVYDTSNAEKLSPALQAAGALPPHLITKMVHNFIYPMWRTQENVHEVVKSLIVINEAGSSRKPNFVAELASKLDLTWIDGNGLRDTITMVKKSNGIELSLLDNLVFFTTLKLRVIETVRSTQLLNQEDDRQQLVLTISGLTRQSRSVFRDVFGDGSMRTTFVNLESADTHSSPAIQDPSAELVHWDESDVLPLNMDNTTAQQAADLLSSVPQ